MKTTFKYKVKFFFEPMIYYFLQLIISSTSMCIGLSLMILNNINYSFLSSLRLLDQTEYLFSYSLDKNILGY